MKKGFTLIELAVVTVIVGLLIAGLIIGQSLVSQAKLQKVITDIGGYEAASRQFKEKYKFWPGDYPFASEQWDVAAATSGNHNGDGDGRINNQISSSPVTNERLAFWQHLSKAGLVKNSYNGVEKAVPFQLGFDPGVNTPKLDLGNRETYNGLTFEDTIIYPLFNFSVEGLQLSGVLESGSVVWSQSGGLFRVVPGFTAEESYYIDNKIDDGAPSGRLVGTIPVSQDPNPASPCIVGGAYDLSFEGTCIALGYLFED